MNIKEDYMIRIDGTMEGEKGSEPDHVKLVTRGSLTVKDGCFYISYAESEATGYAGCTTTVKISRDASRAAMLRFGNKPSQLVIEKGRRHICHYETGYGSLTLGISADEISHSMTENGGKARFSYILDSGDTSPMSRNTVDITVTPLPR